VVQLARERCFDLNLVDPSDESEESKEPAFYKRPTKYGIISKELALLSNQEIMFECKFQVHGLCQSKCLEKAADAKT